MTAYAGTSVVVEDSPSCGVKKLWVYTQDDADATDTIAVTLTDYGISATGLLAVRSYKHTTNGSVIVAETNTTAVSSGVLTITVGSGTDNDVRVIEIIGLSYVPDWTS